MAIHYANDVQKVMNTLSADKQELALDVAVKLFTNGIYTNKNNVAQFAQECIMNGLIFANQYVQQLKLREPKNQSK